MPPLPHELTEACQPLRRDSGLVFFSGGTALNETARALSHAAHSTHIVTTFDSGGSTAELRKNMPIPGVGDIRSRLLALADDSLPEVAALKQVMEYRFPKEAISPEHELMAFKGGTHPAGQELKAVWGGMHAFVCASLGALANGMAGDFDYAGASVGNLLLAAQYFRHGRNLQRAVDEAGMFLHAKGRVVPVSETEAHLAVLLENGRVLVGQHTFTGKWKHHISSPIVDIWLVSPEGGDTRPTVVTPGEAVCPAIEGARRLCYPIGSFFSSVVANLLVKGVGQSIATARCHKIFVPNPGRDPELFGLSLLEQVRFLVKVLQKDAPGARPQDLVSGILVDRRGAYAGGIPVSALREMGLLVYGAGLLEEKPLEQGIFHISGESLSRELLASELSPL